MSEQTNNSTLAQNLYEVRSRINASARRSGREPSSVHIVAVTKHRSIVESKELLTLGEFDLGENYPQELWHKEEGLRGLGARWHLIGHLQSNKARKTLPLVHMIHAVDSLRLLRALDELAAKVEHPPRVFLQVNCSGEAAKHGWSPHSVIDDAEAIAAIRSVPIVGLMTMASLVVNPESARPDFVLLRETRDSLAVRTGLPLPELSMGMSNDYEVAVEEGASWVRIGTALFEGVRR